MSDGSTSWAAILPWIYGAGWLTSVAGEIALLIIIVTVVRRHRPDAYGPLVVWAAVSIALGIFSGLGGLLSTRLAAGEGIDAMLRAQAINALIGIAGRLTLVVLLIRGLVAIAQPPKVAPIEGTPPYR